MHVIHISPYISPLHDNTNGTARVLGMLSRVQTPFLQDFMICGRIDSCRGFEIQPISGLSSVRSRLVVVNVDQHENHAVASEVLTHAREYARGSLRYLEKHMAAAEKTLFIAHGCEALIFASVLRRTMDGSISDKAAWCLQTHFWLPTYRTIVEKLVCDADWKPPLEDLEARCALVDSALQDVDAVYVENASMLQGEMLADLAQQGIVMVEPLTAVDADFGCQGEGTIVSSDQLVISAGRCAVEKGHHIAIDGFCDAVSATSSFNRSPRLLVIANSREGGDYPHQRNYRDALGAKAQMSRVANVRITGGVCRERLAAVLRRAGVVVMASFYEPFGMMALEAYMSGAALVLSREVGCLGLLEGRDRVFTFDVNSRDELQAALLEALAVSGHINGSTVCERDDLRYAWSADRLVERIASRLSRHVGRALPS